MNSKKDWPFDLIEDVLANYRGETTCPDLPTDIELTIQYLVDCTLSEREAKVINMYYKERVTIRQVGGRIGLTPERIRQIKNKAIRKLRHPSRANLIVSGLTAGIPQICESRYKDGYSKGYKKGFQDGKSEKQTENLREVHPPAASWLAEPSSIEALDLGIRTYNALRRANIKTIADLQKTPSDQLLRIRNIGKKALNEIRLAMEMRGYVYPTDSEKEEVYPKY